ncbi:PCYOX oxidase, partial [Jacana jacana]|nr:PCYOX oxidase [Jacana jacana]
GLTVAPVRDRLAGFYDGEEFVFEESSWYLLNLLKLLWRYGLNPLRMYMWVEDILDKFMRIYRYQAHDYAFSSNEGLMRALGGEDFTRMLNQSIDEALQRAGFSQKFINEVVCPAMRFNYGQGVNINSFVGEYLLRPHAGSWPSCCPPGHRFREGLKIKGLKSHRVGLTELFLPVLLPPRTPPSPGEPVNLYHVTYNTSSGLTGDTYDIVLVAAPLGPKMANITFKNFQPPIPEFPNPYHQTVTTFIHGRLNASFFGYRDPSAFRLGSIFTMENPKLFINSLGIVSPVEGEKEEAGRAEEPPLAVWKVFSQEELTKEQLNLLFKSYDSVKMKKWLAYPHYSPPERSPPLVLHHHLYYLNGLERAASAAEFSALAAKNAALLAFHRWHGNTHSLDQPDLQEKLKTEL